ncbi:MAG: hypothetical protein ABIY48_08250 [Acidimicrobiales bacterium]
MLREDLGGVPEQRLQWAVTRRSETDYVFDFWTALGWTILTCGIYGLYVFYRLFWRSVEHNKRRLEVLDAARWLAWERTTASGRAEELTPRFQALGVHIAELQQLTTEFRDPVIWTIIAAVSSGIGHVVGYVFLDQDLVRHDRAEQAAEQELAAIFAALEVPVSLPAAGPTKQAHSYVGRIVALLATCGFYGLWWSYDLMVEGNEHQRRSWASDDAFWVAAGALAQR